MITTEPKLAIWKHNSNDYGNGKGLWEMRNSDTWESAGSDGLSIYMWKWPTMTGVTPQWKTETETPT